MLELYYNFFDKFCNADTFEELEMDNDSLNLALEHDRKLWGNTIVMILSKLTLYKTSSQNLLW